MGEFAQVCVMRFWRKIFSAPNPILILTPNLISPYYGEYWLPHPRLSLQEVIGYYTRLKKIEIKCDVNGGLSTTFGFDLSH